LNPVRWTAEWVREDGVGLHFTVGLDFQEPSVLALYIFDLTGGILKFFGFAVGPLYAALYWR
jgi:hypothetical protein